MAKQHMINQAVDGANFIKSQPTQRAFVQRASMTALKSALLSLMTTTHECCLKGLRRLAVGRGIDEAAPRRGSEVEHVREELLDDG